MSDILTGDKLSPVKIPGESFNSQIASIKSWEEANGTAFSRRAACSPKQYQGSPNDHSVGVIECSFPPRHSTAETLFQESKEEEFNKGPAFQIQFPNCV
ncbi:hypothetical protein CEXT_466071 [Caerostris extrusa]|uniref:Uncharacterized protein n=1 Tax=Caerostris extrusa TaxID=172846 RepID=A0AAV4XXU2_CAEEX|nr:hypothetical protein CEXT_466071 [Caerostris extrusa]